MVSPALLDAMLAVSRESLMHKAPSALLLQGIPAGFLIATVAWLRAASSGGEFWIVFTLTFAIALGDFTHVVAGAAEAFLLLVSGEVGPARVVGGMILPALLGNVIGGTGLFALWRMPRSGRNSDRADMLRCGRLPIFSPRRP